MSKVYYFMILTIGLTILMKMAGVPYGGEEVLNWIGLNTDSIYVTTSYFFIAVVAVFGIAATIGAVFSNKEAALRAGISSGIMGIGIGCFVGILNYVKDISTGSDSWVFYVVFLIFAVYIVGFIFAMIDFWGGTN